MQAVKDGVPLKVQSGFRVWEYPHYQNPFASGDAPPTTIFLQDWGIEEPIDLDTIEQAREIIKEVMVIVKQATGVLTAAAAGIVLLLNF